MKQIARICGVFLLSAFIQQGNCEFIDCRATNLLFPEAMCHKGYGGAEVDVEVAKAMKQCIHDEGSDPCFKRCIYLHYGVLNKNEMQDEDSMRKKLQKHLFKKEGGEASAKMIAQFVIKTCKPLLQLINNLPCKQWMDFFQCVDNAFGCRAW